MQLRPTSPGEVIFVYQHNLGRIVASGAESYASEPLPGKLRVGVLLDTWQVPRWLQAVVEHLRHATFVQLVFIVTNHRPARKSLWRKAAENWRNALYTLWTAWDYRYFRNSRKDAFEFVALHARSAPVVSVQLTEEGTLSEADLKRIRTEHLDVLLSFASTAQEAELPRCARLGMWSFGKGVGSVYEPFTSTFWDMYRGNEVVESELRLRISEAGCEHTISRSLTSMDRISLYRCQNATFWKLPGMVVRQLHELYRTGHYPQSLRTDAGRTQVDRPPGNLAMVKFLARWVVQVVFNRITTHVLRDQWFVAYRDNQSGAKAPVHLIRAEDDRFYADPFVLEHEGRNYIFFEDYSFQTGKGVISFVEVDERGSHSEPELALECDYHISYPFLFHWHDDVYMIPETSDNHTVELYRAVEFPRRWELVRVLMEGVTYVDPTLLEHDGKLWLFAGRRVPGGSGNDELLLFHADSLFGPWTPHPQNPIVSDVRRARPAGRLFMEGGRLIRPSQDCSKRYGYAVVLNRVDVLSTTEYHETPIGRISPDWYPGNLGTHTLNHNDALQVVDARTIAPIRGRLFGRSTAAQKKAA